MGEVWRLVCEDDPVPNILTLNNSCLAATETCLCGICFLCCCQEQLTKVNVQQERYAHCGVEVLIGNDLLPYMDI